MNWSTVLVVVYSVNLDLVTWPRFRIFGHFAGETVQIVHWRPDALRVCGSPSGEHVNFLSLSADKLLSSRFKFPATSTFCYTGNLAPLIGDHCFCWTSQPSSVPHFMGKFHGSVLIIFTCPLRPDIMNLVANAFKFLCISTVTLFWVIMKWSHVHFSVLPINLLFRHLHFLDLVWPWPWT